MDGGLANAESPATIRQPFDAHYPRLMAGYSRG